MSQKKGWASFFAFFAKLKLNKFFRIFFLAGLYALALLGIVLGLFNFFQKEEKNDVFAKSYQLVYQLNVNQEDASAAETELKNAAQAFGNWLTLNNTNVNQVGYYLTKNNEVNQGFLTVNLSNVREFDSGDNNDTKAPFEPKHIAIQNQHNSAVSVWSFNPTNNNNPNVNGMFYSDLPLVANNLFDYSTTNTIENNNAVVVNLKNSVDLSAEGKIFTESSSMMNDDGTNEMTFDSANDLQWVFIQNLDGLINLLNYAKHISFNHQFFTISGAFNNIDLATQRFWKTQYDSFKALDPDVIAWSDIAIDKVNDTTFNGLNVITQQNFFPFYQVAANNDRSNNRNIFGKDANENLKRVVDKFILGTVNKTNYKTFFQIDDSDPDATVDFTNISQIAIPQDNQIAQTQLATRLLETTLPVEFLQNQAGVRINETNQFNLGVQGAVINPLFNENSLLNNEPSLFTFYLATLFVLLTIGIIVSIFYRVPGMLGFFAIATGFIYSFVFAPLLNLPISLGTIFAFLLGLFMAVWSFTFVMNRLKGFLLQQNSVFNSIQTAVRNALFRVVDGHVVVIIIGLSLFLIGTNNVQDFGIGLLLISLLNIASNFVLLLFPLYLLSFFKSFWKQKLLMLASNKPFKWRFWINFAKWWWLWAILIAFVIVGAAVFGGLGFTNSFFTNGFILQVLANNPQNSADNQAAFNTISNLLNNNWYGKIISDQAFIARINQPFNQMRLLEIINSNIPVEQFSVNFARIEASLATNVLEKAFFGLLTGFALCSFYYLLRFNFLSVLPFFLLNLTTTGLTFAFSYLVQFNIDEFFVYVLLFNPVYGNFTACLLSSIVKNKTPRKSNLDYDIISSLLKENINSLFESLLINLVLNTVAFAVWAFTINNTISLTFVNLLLTNSFTLLFAFFMFHHLYYYVLLFKQKYFFTLRKTFDAKINAKNPELDEQLVMNVNKFY